MNTRRKFLMAVATGTILMTNSPIIGWAFDKCLVDHPLEPPYANLTGQCPNCGMLRPMWARTWFLFDHPEGKSQACSFHCLADKVVKSNIEPRNIRVALYLNPEKTVPIKAAFFVVGSKARGTMTMQSKIAFPSKMEALKFVTSCGGEVVGYEDALKVAIKGVAKENQMLVKKRLKKGVIVEPKDNQDLCLVCNMYPARYPKHKCHIITKNKEVVHFCSTQCLFEFLDQPEKYAKEEMVPFRIWVVDFPTGTWISGMTAYYVFGSSQPGPMGHEAIAFDKKISADDYAQKEGGRVQIFSKLGIDDIKPK